MLGISHGSQDGIRFYFKLQYQAMGMEDDEEEPQAIEEDEIYDTFQGIDVRM